MSKNKQFYGIDISKDVFDVVDHLEHHHQFLNNASGFKKFDKISFPENYFFRGPVSWMIRTFSKFLHLPATYSSQGSHYIKDGGNMSDGLI